MEEQGILYTIDVALEYHHHHGSRRPELRTNMSEWSEFYWLF